MRDIRRFAAPVLLFLIAVGAGSAVKAYSGYTLDDAYIGYRYAENIADGDGFVFNPGERELGTTTPLYILVLAGFHVVGFGTEGTSLVLGLLAFGGTVVASFSLARRLGASPAVAFLLGLGLCGYPPLLKDTISGMETPVYAFLTLIVFRLALDRRHLAFSLVGGLLFLLRPDGAFVLAAAGLFDLIFRRAPIKTWVRNTAIVLLVAAPWLIFAWAYFGSPLPNSGFAKILQMADWGHFSKLILKEGNAVLILLPLVFLAAAWAATRELGALLPGFFVLLYFAAFSVLKFPACPWYLGPVHAPILISAALGAEYLLASREAPRRVIWIILAAVGLIHASAAPEAVRSIKKDQANVDGHHVKIGRWLAENAPRGVEVAVDNIGYIGYLSGCHVIDVTGLIQREILEGIRTTGNLRYAIETRRPPYLAIQDRGATPKYTPSTRWLEEQGYRIVFAAPYGETGRAYHVWQRQSADGD